MKLALIKDLKMYYGDRLLLDINKFEVFSGDRIGIVGKNGVGKTTLIKLLIGEITAEVGNVFLTDSYSYISQEEGFFGNCDNGKIKKIFNVPDSYKEYLSGGEKIKIRIAKALSENKSIIIADEPTSNLDVLSIEKLIRELKKYKGSLLVVSHDRNFLDEICNKIVEIENGKINIYKGSYSRYMEQKNEEIKNREVQYKKYINEKERLEKAITEKRRLRDKIKKAPKGMGQSEAKTIKMGDQRGKKTLDNNIKAIKKRIEHMEVKEKPKQEEKIFINIQPALELVSETPIVIENFDLYCEDRLLVKNINISFKKNSKVGIVGENGSGKTSLIKKILDNKNKEIRIVEKARIGYFDQEQKLLDNSKTIIDNLKESSSYDESFIRMNLDAIGIDNVDEVVKNLSGGERVKVSICKVILSDNNILILDEPTNYLDIKSIEALEDSLINTDKLVIIVSHDKKFISNICNEIIEIKDKKLIDFKGTYEEYLGKQIEPKMSCEEKVNKDRLLLLENKLAEVISKLSIETDVKKKNDYDEEYGIILHEINNIKNR